MFKCKKCGGTNILIERRIDGNCECKDCGFVWKNYQPKKRCKVCQESNTVKEFAEKIKSFIDEYSGKVLSSKWSDNDKLLHSLICETIYTKIKDLAAEYDGEVDE